MSIFATSASETPQQQPSYDIGPTVAPTKSAPLEGIERGRKSAQARAGGLIGLREDQTGYTKESSHRIATRCRFAPIGGAGTARRPYWVTSTETSMVILLTCCPFSRSTATEK
jgi:hypothetical protein